MPAKNYRWGCVWTCLSNSAVVAAILAAFVPLPGVAQNSPYSLTLPQAMELIDRANPGVQLARLRALDSHLQARQTASALGPQLSAQISQHYQTTDLATIGLTGLGFPSRVGPYRLFDSRPVLTQTVLDLSLRSALKAATLDAREADENANVVAEEARLTVIELYLEALQAESRVRAAEGRRVAADATRTDVRQAFQAGTANRLELVRADRSVEREQTTIAQAAADRETLGTLLIKTLGLDNAGPLTLQPIPPPAETADTKANLVREALQHRPEIEMQRLKYEAAQAGLERAERERLPRIEASGDFGAIGEDPAHARSTWTIGVSVNVPLWTSGRIESGIQSARNRIEQGALEKLQLEQQIAQEVAQGLAERTAAKQSEESAHRWAEAAREAVDLSRQRFQVGLTPSTESTLAQGDLSDAEEEEIHARYAGWLALAKLARARGDTRLFVNPR
jgi:outer membrane protein TolC